MDLDEEILTGGDGDGDDEVEEIVVSDSRARRKRKRGESVTRQASTTEKKGRPTPSRRQTARPAGTTTIESLPVIGSVAKYLRGVYSEMQKVTWPTRDETINLTQVVLAVTIAFAIGLGLLDTFYSWWFRRVFEEQFTTFFGIGAIVLLVAGSITYMVFYRQDETIPY
jgi:preprotein translocase subunit SecE